MVKQQKTLNFSRGSHTFKQLCILALYLETWPSRPHLLVKILFQNHCNMPTPPPPQRFGAKNGHNETIHPKGLQWGCYDLALCKETLSFWDIPQTRPLGTRYSGRQYSSGILFPVNCKICKCIMEVLICYKKNDRFEAFSSLIET